MEPLIMILLSANNLGLYFIRYYIEYIVINRHKFRASHITNLYLFEIFVNNVIVSNTFNLFRAV